MQNQRTSSQKTLSRLMTIVCILFLCMTVFSLPFLPEYIAIQWRGAEPVNYASRWFILVLPGTALITAFLYPYLSQLCDTYFLPHILAPYLVLSIWILLFSCEAYTILFALFPHTSISLSSVIISECLLSLVVYFLVLIYRRHR